MVKATRNNYLRNVALATALFLGSAPYISTGADNNHSKDAALEELNSADSEMQNGLHTPKSIYVQGVGDARLREKYVEVAFRQDRIFGHPNEDRFAIFVMGDTPLNARCTVLLDRLDNRVAGVKFQSNLPYVQSVVRSGPQSPRSSVGLRYTIVERLAFNAQSQSVSAELCLNIYFLHLMDDRNGGLFHDDEAASASPWTDRGILLMPGSTTPSQAIDAISTTVLPETATNVPLPLEAIPDSFLKFFDNGQRFLIQQGLPDNSPWEMEIFSGTYWPSENQEVQRE